MKKRLHLLIIIYFLATVVFAQNKRVLNKANREFQLKNYGKALSLYLKDSADLNTEGYYKVAECYHQMHDYDKSLCFYNKIIGTDFNNDSIHFHYAQLMENFGDYELAAEHYKLFLEKNTSNAIAQNHLYSSEHKNEVVIDTLVSLKGLACNTSENDFVSFLDINNKLVIASGGMKGKGKVSNLDNQHFLDLYRVKNVEDKAPIPIDSRINSKLHEGYGVFDKGNNMLYYTSNISLHTDKESQKILLSNLNIYTSLKTSTGWSHPQLFPLNDLHDSYGHPSKLEGDNRLFFVSNRAGSIGESDIYVTRYQNGNWSEPHNLGAQINTKGKEMFPYILNDSTLIFASDGLGGLGGLDLFRAKITKDNQVVEVTNMGVPFNSSRDDFAIVYDTETSGYLSSNRVGGKGKDDVYYFERKKTEEIIPAISLIHIVNDSTKAKVAGAQVSISNLQTDDFLLDEVSLDGEVSIPSNPEKVVVSIFKKGYHPYIDTISSDVDSIIVVYLRPESTVEIKGRLVDHLEKQPISGATVLVDHGKTHFKDKTNEAGEYSLHIPENRDEKIKVRFEKQGYLTVENELDVKDSLVSFQDIPVQKVQKGDFINLENIYYEYNKDYITHQASEILDSLVTIMKLNPSLEIEVSSYADSRGTASYNFDLSLRRAGSVVKYLVDKGVSNEKLSVKYFGENKLANDCDDGVDCDERDHSKNRRTEFKIINI